MSKAGPIALSQWPVNRRTKHGFAPASDSQSTLLAQINRIYGIAGRIEPVGSYRDNFGFITD